MRSRERWAAPEEAQDYMVTVGDLMAGLVFLFILALMVFLLQFQTETTRLQSTNETRTLILEELRDRLLNEGIEVTVDIDQGVLRLSDSNGNIGFQFGRETVFPEHRPKVEVLARVLGSVVPCFAKSVALHCALVVDTVRHAGRIHALQIEGHTDTIPFGQGSVSRFSGNLELSAARAAHIHDLLSEFQPGLLEVRNLDDVPVLGVAGYGAERRLPNLPGSDDRQRRIDLRFIMEPPRGSTPAPVQEVGTALDRASGS